MIDTCRQVRRQHGHGARLTASAADQRPKLFDGLQRFAVASCEAFEDEFLFVGLRATTREFGAISPAAVDRVRD